MAAPYKTGTVSTTANSTAVTGAGTGWSVNAVTGGVFSCAGTAIPIQSVNSDTSITLAYPWTGTTAAGRAYAIQPESDSTARVAAALTKLNDLLAGIAAMSPQGAALTAAVSYPAMLALLGALPAAGGALTGALDMGGNNLAGLKTVNGGPLSGVRNKIVNGSFRVNQRGFAGGALSSGLFGHDRWKASTGGATYTVTAGLATITSGSIEQVVEGAAIEHSGTYVINWTGTATCTVNGAAKAKGGTIALTAGSNATVKFTGGSVTDVQLEPGDTPTAPEDRSLAAELALCHRYFWRRSANGAAYDVLFMGSAFGVNSCWGGPIKFPQPMRAAPALSWSAIGDIKGYVSGERAASGLTGAVIDQFQFAVGGSLTFPAGASFAVGDAVMVYLRGGGYLDFSAEL